MCSANFFIFRIVYTSEYENLAQVAAAMTRVGWTMVEVPRRYRVKTDKKVYRAPSMASIGRFRTR